MTTPVYKWPLPVGTDKVKNGDDAIRALGNGIDADLAPHECEGSSATAGSVPPAAWTRCSITQQLYKIGTDCTVAGNGITIGRAGRYLVIGTLSFTNGAQSAGRRIVSLGPAGGSAPSGGWDAITAPGTTSGQDIQVVQTATLPAGYVLGLWGYQDSGVTLQLPGRRLIVRRLNA